LSTTKARRSVLLPADVKGEIVPADDDPDRRERRGVVPEAAVEIGRGRAVVRVDEAEGRLIGEIVVRPWRWHLLRP